VRIDLILVRVTVPGTQVQPPGWYPDPAGQARFRHWDGKSWTAETSNAKDPVNGRALGPGFARLGDWLGHMLRLCALVAVVEVVVYLWLWQEVRSSVSAVDSLLPVLSIVSLASVVALLCTGVVWCLWQVRLARAAPQELRRGPGWHVAGWLIPVASLWMPYQNISSLWHAYGAGREESTQEVSPLLMPLWWGTWLCAWLLDWFASLQVVSDSTRAAREGREADPWAVLSHVALWSAAQAALVAVAALLASRLVRRLSWRALVFWSTTP
jgi:Domain of unknown function (DUF4328)/Protein of unknown function (DUF2510)